MKQSLALLFLAIGFVGHAQSTHDYKFPNVNLYDPPCKAGDYPGYVEFNHSDAPGPPQCAHFIRPKKHKKPAKLDGWVEGQTMPPFDPNDVLPNRTQVQEPCVPDNWACTPQPVTRAVIKLDHSLCDYDFNGTKVVGCASYHGTCYGVWPMRYNSSYGGWGLCLTPRTPPVPLHYPIAML